MRNLSFNRVDRVSPPPVKKSLDFKLPIPEKIHSFGENEMWYLPSTISEAIKIEFVFKAGKYYESRIGDAQFSLHLLDKGIPGKSAHEIANELDYYGAHLDMKVGFDFASISLYGLKKNIPKLLPLIYSIIHHPTFPENELQTSKRVFSENLKVNLKKNDFIGSNAIREKIYGSHPYGQNISLSDIESINIDSLQSFFVERIKPYQVFIVGDLDSTDLKSLIDNIDLSISPLQLANHSIEQIQPSFNSLQGPNNTQASIRFGARTISRNHPDWAGLQLVNHILGGYFGSRLMKNIREEKGLSYGIHSSIQSHLHSSWINIAAEVNSEKVELALTEIKNELCNLDKIGLDELEMTKSHFIGALQNDITTIFAASERIKSLTINNLPSSFYQDMILGIDKIKCVDLHRISKDYFTESIFSIMVVK